MTMALNGVSLGLIHGNSASFHRQYVSIGTHYRRTRIGGLQSLYRAVCVVSQVFKHRLCEGGFQKVML